MYVEYDDNYFKNYNSMGKLGKCKAVIDALKSLNIWSGVLDTDLPITSTIMDSRGNTCTREFKCGLGASDWDYVGNLLVTLPNYSTPLFFFCAYPMYNGTSLSQYPMVFVSYGLDNFETPTNSQLYSHKIYTAGILKTIKPESKPYPNNKSTTTRKMMDKSKITELHSPVTAVFDTSVMTESSNKLYISYIKDVITIIQTSNTYNRGNGDNGTSPHRNGCGSFTSISPVVMSRFNREINCDYSVISDKDFCTYMVHGASNGSNVYLDTSKDGKSVVGANCHLINYSIDSVTGEDLTNVVDSMFRCYSEYDRRMPFPHESPIDITCNYDNNYVLLSNSSSSIISELNYDIENVPCVKPLYKKGKTFSDEDIIKNQYHYITGGRNTFNNASVLMPIMIYVHREPITLRNLSAFSRSNTLFYYDATYSGVNTVIRIEDKIYLVFRKIQPYEHKEVEYDNLCLAVLVDDKGE